MAFTMHSHSGQFCPGHAVDQLEDIIQHAISIGYTTMALTEHMPRYEERDLYPEELEDPKASLAVLRPRHQAYLDEAQRLQAAYASQIHILIGFEAEFIRPSYAQRVLDLAADPRVDYFLGSVHHVHGVPIDFDRDTYARAVAACDPPTEERLFEDYYDLQHDMLLALRPRVVAHFDLVRLFGAGQGAADVRRWAGVWERVKRNLAVVLEQGGWLECNSAGLRKGLDEPYPCRAIAEEWHKMGGKFTMSDDSHGIAQVATNYSRALTYLQSLGVTELWTFRRQTHGDVLQSGTKATLQETSVPISAFRALLYI